MITLGGEERPGPSLRSRLAIVAFVIAGIFVPALFLTAKSGEGFIMEFIGGLAVAVPVLALLAYILRKNAVKNHYGNLLCRSKGWRKG